MARLQIIGFGIDPARGQVSLEWIDPDELDPATGVILSHRADNVPFELTAEVAEHLETAITALAYLAEAIEEATSDAPAAVPGTARR